MRKFHSQYNRIQVIPLYPIKGLTKVELKYKMFETINFSLSHRMKSFKDNDEIINYESLFNKNILTFMDNKRHKSLKPMDNGLENKFNIVLQRPIGLQSLIIA